MTSSTPTTRSARGRVASIRRAFGSSVCSTQRRAASGDRPCATCRSTSRVMRSVLVALDVPALGQQRADALPPAAVEQQVVALGDHRRVVRLDGDRTGDRLLEVAAELGRVHGRRRAPQPIEEVDVPVDVERVGSALAIGATEPFELATGEVETVHRHDDRGRRQLLGEAGRVGRLAGAGRPGDPDQASHLRRPSRRRARGATADRHHGTCTRCRQPGSRPPPRRRGLRGRRGRPGSAPTPPTTT